MENSNFATTLTVGAKRDHLEKVQSEDLILDDVIPGTKVDFFIEEVIVYLFFILIGQHVYCYVILLSFLTM